MLCCLTATTVSNCSWQTASKDFIFKWVWGWQVFTSCSKFPILLWCGKDVDALLHHMHTDQGIKGWTLVGTVRNKTGSSLATMKRQHLRPVMAGPSVLPSGRSVPTVLWAPAGSPKKGFPGSCPLFKTMQGLRCQGTRLKEEACHHWSVFCHVSAQGNNTIKKNKAKNEKMKLLTGVFNFSVITKSLLQSTAAISHDEWGKIPVMQSELPPFDNAWCCCLAVLTTKLLLFWV